MRSLDDLAPLVYRIGFASQSKDKETGEVTADPLRFATHSIDTFIRRAHKAVEATSYTGYLTGKGNFRSIVDPMYKMNRKDSEKPIHYQALRDHLVKRWGAKVIDGSEADDAMSWNQGDDTIIQTIDKDLRMVAGKHRNYVTGEFFTVTAEEGTLWFYAQMLAGDKVDNIPGIKGVGMKTAIKMLEAVTRELWDEYVLSCYELFKEKADEKVSNFDTDELTADKNYDYVAFAAVSPFQRMAMNSQLLWMIQSDRLMPIEFKELMDEQ